MAVLAVWLRLAAMRKLRWNVNYNVKPREISAAQVRCWLGCKPYTLKRLRMMLKHQRRLTADAAIAVCSLSLWCNVQMIECLDSSPANRAECCGCDL